MNKNKALKGSMVVGTVLIVLLVVSSFCLGRSFNEVRYNDVATIIGVICEKDPTLQDTVMAAIKASWSMGRDEISQQEDMNLAGRQLLSRYGYEANQLVMPFGRIGTVYILPMLLMIGIAGIVVVLQQHYYKKRINELTDYLECVNREDEKVLLIKEEDNFSILEDAIYKTVNTLYESRKQALKDKQMLKDHLSDIAHQLKTPLTSMTIMSDLLADEAQDDEERSCILQIQKQLTHLTDLINALLIFSKLDAQVIEMKQEKISVYILLLRVMEMIEPITSSKQQRFILEGEKAEEIQFIGDLKWSMEALYNLIKNASEYAPIGSQITLSYEKNPLFTQIQIEDEGEGFNEEDIPHLFERFYKGKNASKDSVGIGLALARNLVAKQNGVIEAENRREGGARFTIKIYSH